MIKQTIFINIIIIIIIIMMLKDAPPDFYRSPANSVSSSFNIPPRHLPPPPQPL
jgi:hypothetical protein